MQVEQSVKKEEPKTLTDVIRALLSKVLNKIGTFINGLGIHPNQITTLGLLGTLVGAYFVARGQFTLGGFLLLLMGPIDALDGAVARARGEPEDFGAFVDSVTDRYIELAIYAGLLWYYFEQGNLQAMFLVYLAAAGSVLVSYVRARAQSLGFEAKVGILTRFERMVVIGPAILFRIPLVGVVIVAVFANITAIQRIVHVRRQSRQR
ncbi:CDP-alcohol phosphatidyltransferase family protein [Chloroflexota bacterium]